MSKSIYEKAKRDLISLTAKFVIPNVDETDYGCIYDRCHFYNILDEQEESYLKTVEKVLEQAQKQEKLLGLHKTLIEEVGHLNSLLKDLYNNKNYSDHDLGQIQSWIINTEKRIETIKKQIKVLNGENNEN